MARVASPAQGVDAYVRARWNDLVRTARCLGAGSSEEAEQLAHDALLRSWRAWPEERRSGDVDVLVYGALLDLCAPADPGTAADVLSHGAALSDDQVEDLLGVRPGPATGWDRELWDGVPLSAAPIERLHASVRAARRSRLLVVVAVAVAGLVTAALVVLLGDDAGQPPEPPEDVVSPIPLAWWGDDVLHLARTTVQAPGLLSMAQSGDDPTYRVVYGDDAGQVVQVEADGTGRRIGATAPGSPVLGADAGRVVWIEEGSPGTPALVLWDPALGAAVASLDLRDSRVGGDARLLGVRDEEVLVRLPGGAVESWVPGSNDTRRTTAPRGGRLDDISDFDVSGTDVLDARVVSDDVLVAVVSRTYLLGRDFDDGITQSGRFPVADLVVCDRAGGACTVALRRAQDIDPSAPGSGIILPR